jgi:hypothetical protein
VIFLRVVKAVGGASRRVRFLPTMLTGLFIVLGWSAAAAGAGVGVVRRW